MAIGTGGCWVLLCATLARAQPVFDAVDQDRGSLVKAALAADPSALNSIGGGGQTPLVHAVLHGKEHAVRALLAAGADTSIGEKDGYTPCHAAAFQGRAAIMLQLIAAGLDPCVRLLGCPSCALAHPLPVTAARRIRAVEAFPLRWHRGIPRPSPGPLGPHPQVGPAPRRVHSPAPRLLG
jgi:hypothetical protein